MSLEAIPPDLMALGLRLAALSPEECEAAMATLSASQQKALVKAIEGIPIIGARIGATVVLTPKQRKAVELLHSRAMHCLLAGGSRSSKTFTHCMFIAERALTVPSRHAILRFRFSHLHASIIEDTWPKMMDLCFPRAGWKMDRQLWVARFDCGSEVWFGGLDEKERVEKVLGQEHSTLFFNEASQIPLASRQTAITRLAQNCGLPLKALYDC